MALESIYFRLRVLSHFAFLWNSAPVLPSLWHLPISVNYSLFVVSSNHLFFQQRAVLKQQNNMDSLFCESYFPPSVQLTSFFKARPLNGLRFLTKNNCHLSMEHAQTAVASFAWNMTDIHPSTWDFFLVHEYQKICKNRCLCTSFF